MPLLLLLLLVLFAAKSRPTPCVTAQRSLPDTPQLCHLPRHPAPATCACTQIGDASATQSPLSFGGFGSMLRHLGRLASGVAQALQEDALSRCELALMQPYQPSLSAAWLFQRAMSVGVAKQGGQQQEQQAGESVQQHGTGNGYRKDAAALQPQAASSTAAAAPPPPPAPAAASLASSPVPLPVARAPTAAAAVVLTDPSAPPPAPAAAPSRAATTDLPPSTASSSSQASDPTPAPKPLSPGSTTSEPPPRPSWLRNPLLPPPSHVNQLLGCNFGVMAALGPRVLKPFLQDTIQLLPLSLTMAGMMLRGPLVIARVLAQLGPRLLLRWMAHYAALVVYTVAHHVVGRPLRALARGRGYRLQRWLDALEYGSASDYKFHG
jgi:hypothetical protein